MSSFECLEIREEEGGGGTEEKMDRLIGRRVGGWVVGIARGITECDQKSFISRRVLFIKKQHGHKVASTRKWSLARHCSKSNPFWATNHGP